MTQPLDVVTTDTHQATHPTRVVWSGRFTDDGASGAEHGTDGWQVSDSELRRRLDLADQLVVWDPPSFPWQTLGGARRAIPLVVRLPEPIGPDDVEPLLGLPLLRHLTEHDRIVDPGPQLRAAIESRHTLTVRWLAPGTGLQDLPAPDPAVVAAKAQHYVIADLVGERLGTDLEGGVPSVAGIATASGPVQTLRARGRAIEVPTSLGVTPPADAAVVRLTDPDLDPATRIALIREGVDALAAGGQLLIAATVVTLRGQGEFPIISTLMEELQEATASMLHVEDLTAVRWPGEPLSRGALLDVTTLQGGSRRR